jgi:TRAP-type mannitol/chloroaromatic compound transport system permease large subunit
MGGLLLDWPGIDAAFLMDAKQLLFFLAWFLVFLVEEKT